MTADTQPRSSHAPPIGHSPPHAPTVLQLARSVEHRPIEAFLFPPRKPDPRPASPQSTIDDRQSTVHPPEAEPSAILILAGMHGDEPKTVTLARRLIEALGQHRQTRSTFVILPLVNPDGYGRRKRRNANRVDINRNFPTANWAPGQRRSRMFGGPAPASEPETRAVIEAVQRFRPDAIITIHSIGRHRFCNNYDGPGKRLAEALARHNGYPVTASIGYPTPGSFGTWAGHEHHIPTVTLELPSHHSTKRCWQDNHMALLSADMSQLR